MCLLGACFCVYFVIRISFKIMNVPTDYFIKQHGYIFVESSLPPNKCLIQTFEYLSKNFNNQFVRKDAEIRLCMKAEIMSYIHYTFYSMYIPPVFYGCIFFFFFFRDTQTAQSGLNHLSEFSLWNLYCCLFFSMIYKQITWVTCVHFNTFF